MALLKLKIKISLKELNFKSGLSGEYYFLLTLNNKK